MVRPRWSTEVDTNKGLLVAVAVEDETFAIGVAGLVDVDQRRKIKRRRVEVINVAGLRMRELRVLAVMP